MMNEMRATAHPGHLTPPSHHQPRSPSSKTTPTVPPITRVLNLVTQHEETYRSQELQLAEVNRRLLELESKQTHASELLSTFRERRVVDELDRLRHTVGELLDQMTSMSRSSKDSQAGQESRSLQLGLVVADVEKMKSQLADLSRIQKVVVESMEQLMARQMEKLRATVTAAVEEQLKAHTRSMQEEIEQIRVECSAASSSSEALALQANSLAMKLRSHMQAASQAEQAASSRMDALQGQTEGVLRQQGELGSSLQALEQDARKVKKHVVKMQGQLEGLQAMGHVAVAADKTARQVKEEFSAVAAASAKLQLQAEEVASLQSSLHATTQALERKLQDTDSRAASAASEVRRDMTMLAESLGACFQHVTESMRRQPSPPSYYQSLLGAAANLPGSRASGLGALGLSVPGLGAPHAAQTEAWESVRSEFDKYLQTYRMRNTMMYQQPSTSSQQHPSLPGPLSGASWPAAVPVWQPGLMSQPAVMAAAGHVGMSMHQAHVAGPGQMPGHASGT